jgi:hypothetical protein
MSLALEPVWFSPLNTRAWLQCNSQHSPHYLMHEHLSACDLFDDVSLINKTTTVLFKRGLSNLSIRLPSRYRGARYPAG